MPFRTKRVGAGRGYDCAHRSVKKVCRPCSPAAAASEVAQPLFLGVSAHFSVAFRPSFFRLPAANDGLVGAYHGLVAANHRLVGANETKSRPAAVTLAAFSLKISYEK